MIHITTKIALILIIPFLASCADVRTAQYVQSQSQAEDSHPAPIKFSKLKNALPVGTELGVFHHGCDFFSSINVGRNFLRGLNQSDLDDRFAQSLEAQGYDVVSSLNTIFDEEYENEFLRSEYKIGGKIIDADLDACKNADIAILNNIHLDSRGFRGQLFLKIEWGVYDSLHRRVVYKTTTEGYVHRKVGNADGLALMINEAFAMAAHNLGADQGFHDLIFYGEKPPQDWRKKAKPESRPRVFDPKEKLVITNPDLSKLPLVKHAKKSSKAAVLVQAGTGHGSGFFVSDQGHIITNAHVVGDAQRVRIVTAGRKDKLIAEVLRKSTERDVALLKLEKIPENLKITALPIRAKYPKISEDIYAIGAPENKRMQDTISKGIVSSIRKNFRVFGTKMDFIQGDIVIRGGNSGGPLLDANGNIIGISVAGMYLETGEGDSGLNLFIPIADALRYLDVGLE